MFLNVEQTRRIWIARLLVLVVLMINLQAALLFIMMPDRFVGAFELSGIPGRAAVQGVGILFLMWQVPYVFAVVNPYKNRRSLVEANLMQLIGLVGETVLLFSIPAGYPILSSSIRRFIFFDAGGLILLLLALWHIGKNTKSIISSV